MFQLKFVLNRIAENIARLLITSATVLHYLFKTGKIRRPEWSLVHQSRSPEEDGAYLYVPRCDFSSSYVVWDAQSKAKSNRIALRWSISVWEKSNCENLKVIVYLDPQKQLWKFERNPSIRVLGKFEQIWEAQLKVFVVRSLWTTLAQHPLVSTQILIAFFSFKLKAQKHFPTWTEPWGRGGDAVKH